MNNTTFLLPCKTATIPDKDARGQTRGIIFVVTLQTKFVRVWPLQAAEDNDNCNSRFRNKFGMTAWVAENSSGLMTTKGKKYVF
ncbi:MAG: hypothetical protein LBL00_07375 [Endomicrobium sp.]|nr:hypothetical protein [Endomicrobium sp.]